MQMPPSLSAQYKSVGRLTRSVLHRFVRSRQQSLLEIRTKRVGVPGRSVAHRFSSGLFAAVVGEAKISTVTTVSVVDDNARPHLARDHDLKDSLLRYRKRREVAMIDDDGLPALAYISCCIYKSSRSCKVATSWRCFRFMRVGAGMYGECKTTLPPVPPHHHLHQQQ